MNLLIRKLFAFQGLLLVGVVTAGAEEPVGIAVDGQERVFYQAEPLVHPRGGERFKGSNFIHPLQTPSGFVVTDCQPADHPHHFGLWWPWKYIKIDSRKILCWELQQGDGLIRAVRYEPITQGLRTESVYLDRQAPGGPLERLRETTRITTSSLVEQPAPGYFLSLEIVHRCAGDEAVEVVPYRYSGFTLRGTASWNKANSIILTSEGQDRDTANFTRARWVMAQGATNHGGRAGVLLMSRPDNHRHPEKVRTWDKQHGGAVFINFNPVMDDAWLFEPGKRYARNYRVFVYDGSLTPEQAEALWQDYAATTTSHPTVAP